MTVPSSSVLIDRWWVNVLLCLLLVISLGLLSHFLWGPCVSFRGLPRWLSGKESTCQFRDAGGAGSIPGQEDPLEEEVATHSSILVWKISWRDEPGGLQSKGLQRVGHDWTIEHVSCRKVVPWKGLVVALLERAQEEHFPWRQIPCWVKREFCSFNNWLLLLRLSCFSRVR